LLPSAYILANSGNRPVLRIEKSSASLAIDRGVVDVNLLIATENIEELERRQLSVEEKLR